MIPRRDFLKLTGLSMTGRAALAQPPVTVSIVTDPSDSVASAAPVRWAAAELRQALIEQHISVNQFESLKDATGLCIVPRGRSAQTAPESFALTAGREAGKRILLA